MRMRTVLRRTASLLPVALGLFGPARAEDGGPPLGRHEFRQTHMGSEFKLILYTTDEPTARRASQQAFARIAHLDATLTDYDPESELMRLCDHAGGAPVPVSEDLFRVLSRAIEMAEKTGGAFDPTVNPVVRLWRRARRERKLPDRELLERARSLVDYRNVRLDPENRTIQLLKPGIKLDLGGIAKGFAADEALRVLKEQGIDRALVAAAGDIAVSGPPPGRDGWTIALAPLGPEPGSPTRSITLSNAAVSTSGDAERFVEIDGTRYSHIVDPRTGLGVVDRAGVTVIAPDASTTDSLATAVYILGPDRGLALVEGTTGTAARVVRRVDGQLEERVSRRWNDLAERAGDESYRPATPDDAVKAGSARPVQSLQPAVNHRSVVVVGNEGRETPPGSPSSSSYPGNPAIGNCVPEPPPTSVRTWLPLPCGSQRDRLSTQVLTGMALASRLHPSPDALRGAFARPWPATEALV
jgi:thiamine biosynthesis lipoprotein